MLNVSGTVAAQQSPAEKDKGHHLTSHPYGKSTANGDISKKLIVFHFLDVFGRGESVKRLEVGGESREGLKTDSDAYSSDVHFFLFE